jgi:hypothetical protein
MTLSLSLSDGGVGFSTAITVPSRETRQPSHALKRWTFTQHARSMYGPALHTYYYIHTYYIYTLCTYNIYITYIEPTNILLLPISNGHPTKGRCHHDTLQPRFEASPPLSEARIYILIQDSIFELPYLIPHYHIPHPSSLIPHTSYPHAVIQTHGDHYSALHPERLDGPCQRYISYPRMYPHPPILISSYPHIALSPGLLPLMPTLLLHLWSNVSPPPKSLKERQFKELCKDKVGQH